MTQVIRLSYDLDMQTESPSEIIDRLGGTTAVARLCDIKPPSVSEWRKVGIPKSWLKFFQATRPDVFQHIEAEEEKAA